MNSASALLLTWQTYPSIKLPSVVLKRDFSVYNKYKHRIKPRTNVVTLSGNPFWAKSILFTGLSAPSMLNLPPDFFRSYIYIWLKSNSMNSQDISDLLTHRCFSSYEHPATLTNFVMHCPGRRKALAWETLHTSGRQPHTSSSSQSLYCTIPAITTSAPFI